MSDGPDVQMCDKYPTSQSTKDKVFLHIITIQKLMIQAVLGRMPLHCPLLNFIENKLPKDDLYREIEAAHAEKAARKKAGAFGKEELVSYSDPKL